MSTLADQEGSLQYQGQQQITRPFSAFERPSLCRGYMRRRRHVTNSRCHNQVGGAAFRRCAPGAI